MKQLTDNVYAFLSRLSYVYLIETENSLILLDSGFDKKAKRLIPEIKTVEEETGRSLTSIIVSHHHIDHTAALWKLEEEFNVPIYAHAADLPIILRKKKPPRGEGVLGFIFHQLIKLSRYHPPKAVHDISEKQFPFKILHLPGHTDGHIALYDETHKTLFSADLFTLTEQKIKYPPKFFTQSNKQNKESVRKLYEMLKSKQLLIENVFPSHGEFHIKDAGNLFIDLLEKEFG